jgi:hypothetical protein
MSMTWIDLLLIAGVGVALFFLVRLQVQPVFLRAGRRCPRSEDLAICPAREEGRRHIAVRRGNRCVCSECDVRLDPG